MHRSVDRQNEDRLQHAVFPAGRVVPTSAAMRFLLIFVAGILAFPTPSFSSDACSESADTATMLSCINDELSAVDAELNLLYGELLSRLQHWDRTGDAGTIGFETRLRESQRAWITFRDAECALRASVMEGGSAQPLIEHGCRAALTKERNAHLRDLLDMFGAVGRDLP